MNPLKKIRFKSYFDKVFSSNIRKKTCSALEILNLPMKFNVKIKTALEFDRMLSTIRLIRFIFIAIKTEIEKKNQKQKQNKQLKLIFIFLFLFLF